MIISYCSLIFILAIGQPEVATSSPSASPIPKLLEQAFLQRLSYKTAYFRVREEYSRDGWAKAVHNRQNKWAGDSIWFRDEGDDDGMIMYVNMRTGEAPLGVSGAYMPVEQVVDAKTGLMWSRRVNSPFSSLSSPAMWWENVDVRTVGLRSMAIAMKDPKGMIDLLKAGDGLSYETPRDRDGLALISAVGPPYEDQSRTEYEWEIDKAKGSAVVCARQFLRHPDGRKVLESEARNSLVQVNGIWWPARVEFTIPVVNGHRVFEFRKIEFNEPHHPATIDADTLGLPNGAPVHRMGTQENERYHGGGVLIDEATWKANYYKDEIASYRAFSNQALSFGMGEFPSWWSSSDGTEGLPEVADRPDLWETYVRRWVMRRTNNAVWHLVEPLTDVQRTTAKGILDECRKIAMPIRMRLDKEAAKVATELAEAEGMLAARNAKEGKGAASTAGGESGATSVKVAVPTNSTKEDQPAPDDALTKRIADLKARKAELAKSPEIERIFDQLKSRLEGLLTSKQKDPANGSLVRGKGESIPDVSGKRLTLPPRPAPAPKP